jgi:hypothetical protein
MEERFKKINIYRKTSIIIYKLMWNMCVSLELLYGTLGRSEWKREQQSLRNIVKQHLWR